MHAFTVHEYQNSRSSPNTALDNGCRLLKSLIFPETQWVPVGGGGLSSYVQSSNSYMFRIQPPVVARNTQDTLKEWNAPCTEDEAFSLENLEEFAGTDLRYLLVSKIAWLPPPMSPSLPPPLPPQARATDSLDNDSLYGAQSQSSNIVINESKSAQPCAQEEQNIIPGFDLRPESRTHEPKSSASNPEVSSHIIIPGFDLDAPLRALHAEHEGSVSTVENAAPKKRRLSQERFITKRRKPVVGSLYHVIPQPHMHPSPFLASNVCPSGTPYARPPLWTTLPPPYDDARVAWLIPVRGALPWDGATPAGLDDAAPARSGARISWTPDALVRFWDFALAVRRSGAFGPVGVALLLHAANARPSPADPALQEDPRSALPAVDFIKIYHDAAWRLYLRAALDEWTLRVDVDVDGEPRELQPLSGARLVLVDEVSRAVLIA